MTLDTGYHSPANDPTPSLSTLRTQLINAYPRPARERWRRRWSASPPATAGRSSRADRQRTPATPAVCGAATGEPRAPSVESGDAALVFSGGPRLPPSA